MKSSYSLSLFYTHTHTHTLKYWILVHSGQKRKLQCAPSLGISSWARMGDCPQSNISFGLIRPLIALWFLLTNSFLPFGAVHPFKGREVWELLGSVTTSIGLKMWRHHVDSGKKKNESYKFCRSGEVQSSKPTHLIQELPWQRQFSKSDSGAKPLPGHPDAWFKGPMRGCIRVETERRGWGGVSVERWRWVPQAELCCA